MKVERQNRTANQNRALHLYLELVADTLDKEGHTLQDVVAQIKRAEIRPTKENLKEVVWRPLQQAIYNKESTTQLETHEVDRVYETMNKWLGQQFEIHVPFPSLESLLEEYESE